MVVFVCFRASTSSWITRSSWRRGWRPSPRTSFLIWRRKRRWDWCYIRAKHSSIINNSVYKFTHRVKHITQNTCLNYTRRQDYFKCTIWIPVLFYFLFLFVLIFINFFLFVFFLFSFVLFCFVWFYDLIFIFFFSLFLLFYFKVSPEIKLIILYNTL